MTVGEYSSIFLHHSLLTLSHLCNFTPRALHALLVWGSDCRTLVSSAQQSILRHFRVGGSLARPRRRFLGPATPEVPRVGHSGGSSVQMRQRFISSAASLEHPSSQKGSKVPSFFACRSPPVSRSLHMLNITRGMSTSAFLRVLRMHLHGGFLGGG